MYVMGPGHGGVAGGTYSEVYPEVSQGEAGQSSAT
jgi:phosphoketolase